MAAFSTPNIDRRWVAIHMEAWPMWLSALIRMICGRAPAAGRGGRGRTFLGRLGIRLSPGGDAFFLADFVRCGRAPTNGVAWWTGDRLVPVRVRLRGGSRASGDNDCRWVTSNHASL
jgi:hypothetical protein